MLSVASLAGRATAQFSQNLFTTISFQNYELLNIDVTNISGSPYRAYAGTLYNSTSKLQHGLVFMGTNEGDISWYDLLAVNTSLTQVDVQDDIIIAGGNTNQTLTGLGTPNMVLYRNVVAGNNPTVLMGGTGNYTRLCHLNIAPNGNLGVTGTLQSPGSAAEYAYLAVFDGESTALPFIAGRKKDIEALGCDNTVMDVNTAGEFVVNFKSDELAANDTYVAYTARLNPSTSAVEAYRFVQGDPGFLDLDFKMQSMLSDDRDNLQIVGYSSNGTMLFHTYRSSFEFVEQASFTLPGSTHPLRLQFIDQPDTFPPSFIFVGDYNGDGILARYDPPIIGAAIRSRLNLTGFSRLEAVVIKDSSNSADYYGINAGNLICLSILGGGFGPGDNNLFESPVSCAGILEDLPGFSSSEVLEPFFSNSALQTSGDFGELSAFQSIAWPTGRLNATVNFTVNAVCGSTDAPTYSPTDAPTNLPTVAPTNEPREKAAKFGTTDDIVSIVIPAIGIFGTIAVVTILSLNRIDSKKAETTTTGNQVEDTSVTNPTPGENTRQANP